MIGSGWTLALLLAGVLMPQALLAQDTAQTFDQLQKVLEVGQSVVVTDVSGERVKGVVASLSPSSVTLDVEDRMGYPDGLRTLSESAVAKVGRRDSVTEGLLIGLAAGVGAAWGGVRYTCGPAGYDPECSANVWTAFALAFIPAGMLTGAVVDRLIGHGAVYVAPAAKPAAAISVAPWIAKGGGGLSMSFAF